MSFLTSPGARKKHLKERSVDVSSRLSAFMVDQQNLKTHLDDLVLEKDKMILRSLSDRLPEMAISVVLGISRDDLRQHGLFTVEKLAANIGATLTFRGGQALTVSQASVDAVKDALANAFHATRDARGVDRGRGHIKAMGDPVAHADPEPFIGQLDKCIDRIWRGDIAKKHDVHLVVSAYKYMKSLV